MFRHMCSTPKSIPNLTPHTHLSYADFPKINFFLGHPVICQILLTSKINLVRSFRFYWFDFDLFGETFYKMIPLQSWVTPWDAVASKNGYTNVYFFLVLCLYFDNCYSVWFPMMSLRLNIALLPTIGWLQNLHVFKLG